MIEKANKIHLFKYISKSILIDIKKGDFYLLSSFYIIYYTYSTNYMSKDISLDELL